VKHLYAAFTILLFIPLFALGQSTQTTTTAPPMGQYNLPGKPPYLVCHYMTWFTTPSSETATTRQVDRNEPLWSHWKWKGGKVDHRPEDRLPNGQRDIASVFYPLIGPYDSHSTAVVRYHLSTMKAAGVSAVLCIWYGPGSVTDKAFPVVLDEAQKLGMAATLCYDEKLNFPEYRQHDTREDFVQGATNDFNYIIDNYSRHPAFLHRNGVPVIEQFNAWAKDPKLGNANISPDEYRTIFSNLHSPFNILRQNLDEKYYPPINAAYVWWDQGKWPTEFAHRAAKLRDQGRLDFFMTMVCPGFNDTGVWGWGDGPRVSKSYGVDVLKWCEDQAFIDNPELVQMITWNDFNEGTCFEPTVQNRFTFLEAIAKWWNATTGKPVDIAGIRTPFETYKQNCSESERAEIPVTVDTQ
jgi:glycoprotein endo-alpha-1,2-mannosidase